MKKSFYLSLILGFLVSCQSTGPEQRAEVIHIDPAKSSGIKRSEILTFQGIIGIREVEGDVRKLVFDEDHFLIVSNKVSLFDRQGQFLNFIGSRGNGPGEYLSVADVVMQDGLVRVLDRTGHKIIDYDRNGVFQAAHHIGFFGQAFGLWRRNTLVYGGFEKNEYNRRLFLFDENLTGFKTAMDYDEKLHYLNVRDKTNFFLFNDSLRFLCAYDYYIYNAFYNGNRFEMFPRYHLDFGAHQIPGDFFHMPYDNIMEFEMALNKTNFAGRLAGYYEDDHQLMFGFRFKGKYYLGIYCKTSGEVKVADSIYDDVLFNGVDFPVSDEWFSLHFHRNQAFLVLDAYQVIDRISMMKESMVSSAWNEYIESNPFFAKLYPGLNENDGPLIFVFDVKAVAGL
jgi:hypothetical protein